MGIADAEVEGVDGDAPKLIKLIIFAEDFQPEPELPWGDGAGEGVGDSAREYM